MQNLRYIAHYQESLQQQVADLLDQGKLGAFILQKYPDPHDIRSSKTLYDYTIGLKNRYMKKAKPLSKVIYDEKIKDVNRALGLHTYATRVQGGKLKSKNEIRIATLFRQMPYEFLRMIVVHELAHIKEKNHDKPFYKLCTYMEPEYHQFEFDARLYLTHLELVGSLYE